MVGGQRLDTYVRSPQWTLLSHRRQRAVLSNKRIPDSVQRQNSGLRYANPPYGLTPPR
jgi:hypothetical protein